MSGRSGAISHTTLHEATKGNRLPSWETTVEFVKACGADPAAYRERWESANQAVRSPGTAPSEPPPPARDQGRRLRPAYLAAVAVVLVGAAVLTVVAVNRGARPAAQSVAATSSPSLVAFSPAECPVPATNPPWAAPLHEGDKAEFVEDVTLPDCTRVGAGETVTKVWRLRNAGTVPWKGYSLRRLDVTQQNHHCQTISDVPIADTQPGETVDIRTEVTTPRKPGLCYVRFKMVDATGAIVFPGNRPINFQLIVG
ncbi:unnamed protein product [[Actinomadura] parvosata subsp. kistnae]|uniref:Nbr1 FW domain-containing protein n=1 Tax=[Actinomadura] parvosata subsp. kistnae TaxID=1909395 RepID=A0A1V0ADH3_9ACTN|nr:NBR1-Ig-like domain-containing protein [Nonomuraea sp. ATCC 55076]AQZ68245.1 hypothetical protein BKM31_48330 [Nonomuraea sp. ATCC 55076]SPL93346.1 unnamed protein product [Actinomadura parvosata subsp. kistnae]